MKYIKLFTNWDDVYDWEWSNTYITPNVILVLGDGNNYPSDYLGYSYHTAIK